MFRRLRLNTYRIKQVKVIIILAALTLTMSFGFHVLSAMAMNKKTVKLDEFKGTLLLSSGLVQADKAEISIVLWFEDRKVPKGFSKSRPIPNWTWTYKELQLDSEKVAVTMKGQYIVNKNEERNLFAWYTTMVPQIEEAGGRIYLDERIPEAIDIAAYLSHNNAVPKQWLLSGNMISTAAYQDNIDTSVVAGQDKINIQLLSRGNNSKGQSVLAIPALLKEF